MQLEGFHIFVHIHAAAVSFFAVSLLLHYAIAIAMAGVLHASFRHRYGVNNLLLSKASPPSFHIQTFCKELDRLVGFPFISGAWHSTARQQPLVLEFVVGVLH